jgi:hypothetical protein
VLYVIRLEISSSIKRRTHCNLADLIFFFPSINGKIDFPVVLNQCQLFQAWGPEGWSNLLTPSFLTPPPRIQIEQEVNDEIFMENLQISSVPALDPYHFGSNGSGFDMISFGSGSVGSVTFWFSRIRFQYDFFRAWIWLWIQILLFQPYCYYF